MANSITPPSWHEDQPNAAEASIANTLASKNMALGGQLLNEYASHRQFAQDDYHQYMQQVNAVQMANIAQAHAEAQGKNVLTALGLKAPGAYETYSRVDPNAPAATPDFLAGVRNAATAENLGNGGKGIAALVESGLEPSSVPGAFSSILPDSAKFGMDSRSKSATIIANSHLGAAGIAAGAKSRSDGKTVLHVPNDPNDPSLGTRDITVPAGGTVPPQYQPKPPPDRTDTASTTGAGAPTGAPTAAPRTTAGGAPVNTAPNLQQRTTATIHNLKATGNPRGAADMMRAVQDGQYIQAGGRDGFAHNGKFYPINK